MNQMKLSVCVSVLALFCCFAVADRIDIPDGFPDASSTGCSGTLTASGSITVTTDNTVIENLEITGGIKIQANNVTVRNCYIIGGLYGVRIYSGYTGTLIEDCTVYNGTSKGIYGANFIARRCDVSMYSDAMFIGSNVVVEDCYLHDFKVTEGSHNDGIQTTGASNITITGCTIQANYQTQTSAIIMQTQYAVIDNILIEGNFLSGGSYTVYLRNKNTGYGDPTNCYVVNNVFEYDSYSVGILSTNGDGIYYSGNIYHTGEPISRNSGIVFDATSSSSLSYSNSLSWSHTIADGFNRALVVGVASEDGTVSDFEVLSVTFDGVAMTPVSNSISTAGAGTRTRTQLFYMLEEDLPAAGSYTITVTRAGENARQSGGAVSLDNVAQHTPEAVVTNTTGTSTATSITTNITTLTDGAYIVDVVGYGLGGSSTPTATDQIECWDINIGGSATHAGSTKEVEFAGTTDMGWSFSSSAHLIATSAAAFSVAGY